MHDDVTTYLLVSRLATNAHTHTHTHAHTYTHTHTQAHTYTHNTRTHEQNGPACRVSQHRQLLLRHCGEDPPIVVASPATPDSYAPRMIQLSENAAGGRWYQQLPAEITKDAEFFSSIKQRVLRLRKRGVHTIHARYLLRPTCKGRQRSDLVWPRFVWCFRACMCTLQCRKSCVM